MMYQLDGLQNKSKADAFLGEYAEGILEDLRAERQPKEGERAFKGAVGMTINDPARVENYV
jgi:hypothetical protein